ncbi:hypothetical protein OSB04_024500 [Centaurea solstitialis]|uniref:Reverse transcriptase Ty1/copia-type domain-containing protein n=1 Tax=Centaurea solstitialis TaxID=347529 RepID=A0AA38T5Q7_9ASTR|nr:hypothetical protein OSB04_024500 [Centaurea solstitialis]
MEVKEESQASKSKKEALLSKSKNPTSFTKVTGVRPYKHGHQLFLEWDVRMYGTGIPAGELQNWTFTEADLDRVHLKDLLTIIKYLEGPILRFDYYRDGTEILKKYVRHAVTLARVTDYQLAMKSQFKMSMMGELTFFLGLQVRQRPDGIFINQAKYVQDLLKRFDFGGSNSAATPMPRNFQLNADSSGKPVDQKTYRAIIGSLLYLTASRPDIVFSTGVCARFQCDPRDSHLSAVKRILRYLKGTPDFGLWYLKDSGFELIAYTDSDHAGCKLNRKSTSGACQFLGDKLVSWSSRKQNCVSLSTAEAEYVAAACCCSQVLWMKTQLADFGYTMQRIPIYCDSKSAIQITANPVQHSRTKHIDIRYHFIKDHVEKGNVELYFVESDYQLVDLFTKPFDEKRHFFLLSKLGMLDLPA